MAETRSQMLFTETVVRETMAETRSQAVVTEETIGSRIQALEDLVKERNQKIDRNISDMLEAMNLLTNKGYSSHVQDLRNSSRVSPAPANSPSDPAHGHRSGISNSYVGVTRLAKLDCPRFGGDRVKEWLFKIEQFFLVDRTPDELKIGLASGLFDDLAATWHQWILQSVLWKHVRHDWVTYKMLLQGRFKELEVDPIVELKQLQETDGIEDFHKKFELIKSQVNLSEAYLVSVYLAGLRPDTQLNVRMFQPQTIQHCFMLGRLYETAHPTSVIISTESDDYQKGVQPLNVSGEDAGPSSNIHVPNALHKDRECFEKKHSIQQEIFVGMENFLQQEELNCGRDLVLGSDRWCVPYANLETELVNQEKSELGTGNKGEVKGCLECVSQPQNVNSTFEDFDKDDATRNQLLSPIGFVLDDLQVGCGSDTVHVQNFASPVVDGDFQNKSAAGQRSARIPLGRTVLTTGRKKTFYKSRRFKFKHRVAPRDFKSGFDVKGVVKYTYPCSSAKVALMKKNKYSKTWFMLKGDCFKEDDQVYRETLPVWLLTRFKYGKFRFVNMNLQKARPQIEDVMAEDHKKQQGASKTDTKVFETFDQYTRKRGSVSADRDTENNQPTLRFSMWVIQSRLLQYMVLPVTHVAIATHFLVEVGMDKKESRLSLRTNRVWDPGGSIFRNFSFKLKLWF